MVSANDELTINENKKTAVFIDDKLFIELEDEIKVNLIINKTKVGTNIKIDKSYFSITDESGNIDIVYTTNGQAVLNGLSIGKTYTVTEKKAQSNIEINPGTFRFKIVREGNDSNKEITITPKDDYKILEIKINGETFDFADRLADDGTVTLDKFTNMMEDQHITAVFERIYREISAKVIVKYLEEGTNKELKTEDMKEGIVGERYTTTRAAISGYEIAGNEPTNANGIMTEEDTVVIYYYKAIREADQTGNSVKNKITANKARSPKTGDNIMIKIAFGIIAFIILMGVKKKRKSVFIGKHFK